MGVDFEHYKFQMVNGETIQFLARVRVSVDVKTGKTVFELPDFGGARGGAGERSSLENTHQIRPSRHPFYAVGGCCLA